MADPFKPAKFYAKPENKSKGIFDDHSVRKSTHTREGTITKTPTENEDIVNKKFVDDEQGNHDIADHNDTTATGSELNTLTDNSIANTLHRHSELVASDGSPDPALSIDATGNVGIGTTSPSDTLSITTLDGSGAIRFTDNGQVNDAYSRIDSNNGDLVFEVDVGAGQGVSYMAWNIDNSEKMRMNYTGNVGIGTTSPDERFSVEDDFLVTSAGLCYYKNNGGVPHGGISVYDNSTADTVSSGSYTQMTRFDTNDVAVNATPDHTNDHITIGKAGDYMVNLSCSFSGTASVEWTGGIFKNNGGTQLTNLQMTRKLGAGGDVGSISVSGIANFAAADTVEVWIKQSSGVDKNITVKDCNLSLVMIGS